MSEQVDISLLEKYLEGDIEAREVLDLNGNQLSEEKLREEIEVYQNLVLSLEAAGLKQELQLLRLEKEKSRWKYNYQRVLAYSIAASLLLFLTLTLLRRDNKPELFEDFFTPFEQLLSFRGSLDPKLDSALLAYSEEDYLKAYSLFQRFNSIETNMDIQFYAGVSALGAKEFNEALNLFKQVLAKGDKYQQQIQWYLALCHWQLGEFDEATFLLEKIESGQFKYEESQILIDLLVD